MRRSFPGCADVNWFVGQEGQKGRNKEVIGPDETDYYLAVCNNSAEWRIVKAVSLDVARGEKKFIKLWTSWGLLVCQIQKGWH